MVAGNISESVSSLQFGRPDFGDIYAEAFYWLGKTYEEFGDKAQALPNYEKFLDLWKEADPGLAEVEDAKKKTGQTPENFTIIFLMKPRFLVLVIILLTFHHFLVCEFPREFSESMPASPKFYVWMGEGKNHTDEYLKAQFKKLEEARVDGVMYLCPPERYPAVIAIADRFGLEVHAWQVILNCRDQDVMENHKDWFTVNGKGESSLDHPPFVGYYKWLCPTNEEVQEYIIKEIDRLADINGLKSIHLDYIRHSDVILPIGLWDKYGLVMDREYPEFDFCYCDVCIQKFKNQAGIDPSKLEEPSENEDWKQFRYDSITQLVNRLAEVVHRKRKLLTAAVFPTPAIAKKLVRQDWANWKLDGVYPMVYHNFYKKDVAWIKAAVQEGVEDLAGKAPLYSGLYLPSLNPKELAQAIDFSFAGDAAGICLFGYESMEEEHWKKLITAVKKYKKNGGKS